MSDSTHRPDADEEWAALLRQLRQQPKPVPQPFFYARVHARLLAGTTSLGLPRWLRRPVYAAVLGGLVLAVSGDGSLAATAGTGPHGSYPVHSLPH